jgi:hypothetical protein
MGRVAGVALATMVAGAMAPSTAHAQIGMLGAGQDVGLQYFGGDVTISGIEKNAGDRSFLYLLRSGTTLNMSGSGAPASNAMLLFDNFSHLVNRTNTGYAQLSDPSKKVTLSQSTLAGFGVVPSGELIFGLFNASSNVWSYTGSSARNFGNRQQADIYACGGPLGCLVSMEDRNSASLYDRNDFVFSVRGGDVVTASAVPEPATFVLLGTGLAGLGVFARRRKTAKSTS